jgi:preprotein translocase subunit SecB
MSETEQQQPQPPIAVTIQFIKDLSFEVPAAPGIYTRLRSQPRVDLNLDVQARRIGETGANFEVVLAIRAEAKEAEDENSTVFVAELAYAGLFALNVPAEAVEPVLLVECPRILFPFARNIMADVTRDGGFPPVMLHPIDFMALWQSRRQQPAAGNA